MAQSQRFDLQALAVEVVRRQADTRRPPAGWDLITRWRDRRYRRRLIDTPLAPLMQAVAKAQNDGRRRT